MYEIDIYKRDDKIIPTIELKGNNGNVISHFEMTLFKSVLRNQ